MGQNPPWVIFFVMIGTTVLLVSMQFLEAEEGYTSINPSYLTTVSNANYLKLVFLLFLNMCLAHLGYTYCSILSPEDRPRQEERSSGRMTGLAEEWGVYTWEPNKELAILGQGT